MTWKVPLGPLRLPEDQVFPIRGMIMFVLCSAAFGGCSALPGLGSSDKPKVAFEFNSAWRQRVPVARQRQLQDALFGAAPEKTGSYNAMFVLAGYIQQTIPVRVTTAKEHWYSSEVVEVSPNPVTAVLKAEPGAPTGGR